MVSVKNYQLMTIKRSRILRGRCVLEIRIERMKIGNIHCRSKMFYNFCGETLCSIDYENCTLSPCFSLWWSLSCNCWKKYVLYKYQSYSAFTRKQPLLSPFSRIVQCFCSIKHRFICEKRRFVKRSTIQSRKRNYIRIEFRDKFSFDFQVQFESNLDCNRDCINQPRMFVKGRTN